MNFSEYSEEKRSGVRSFPVEYYYLNESHPQYVMRPHWHREFEILRVISGELRLYLNAKEYALKPGSIILYGSGVLHRGTPKNCVYECAVFDLGLLGNRYAIHADEYVIELPAPQTVETDKIREIADELLLTVQEKGEFYELRTISLIYDLFFRMYRNGLITSEEKRGQLPKQTRVIAKTLSWIEEHFAEPITLKDLSYVSGMNEKYLCRIFREYTSKSPMSYVNEYRIDNACIKINESRSSLTQIAYDCGFNDSGYFTKIFKKYKGMTPGEYRKIHRPR